MRSDNFPLNYSSCCWLFWPSRHGCQTPVEVRPGHWPLINISVSQSNASSALLDLQDFNCYLIEVGHFRFSLTWGGFFFVILTLFSQKFRHLGVFYCSLCYLHYLERLLVCIVVWRTWEGAGPCWFVNLFGIYFEIKILLVPNDGSKLSWAAGSSAFMCQLIA